MISFENTIYYFTWYKIPSTKEVQFREFNKYRRHRDDGTTDKNFYYHDNAFVIQYYIRVIINPGKCIENKNDII